jgi:hypothetical protein
MKKSTLMYFALLVSMWVAGAQAQTSKYPPTEQYLMPQADEIALARTAAPANISDRAMIQVLTKTGFEVAQQGGNGSVCMVMRGFSAPTYMPAQFRDLVYDATVRAPICFTPPAVQQVLPYYELRTKLALQAKNPDEMAEAIAVANAKIGHWHPHVMVFAPYYNNSIVGGSPLGSPFLQGTDDAGTPFSVVVIPVDDKLADGRRNEVVSRNVAQVACKEDEWRCNEQCE